jgi:predicted transcriptional regulator
VKDTMMPEETKNHVELTGDIVSAYVTANNIQRSELPGLIADVHSALTNLGKPASESVKAEPLLLRCSQAPHPLKSLSISPRSEVVLNLKAASETFDHLIG